MGEGALLWVGHRGWPERYPENTLIGVQAALKRGAHAVEVDIQFSSDGEPAVIHDPTTDRVSAQHWICANHPWQTLQSVPVHEPLRFSDRFISCRMSHLSDIVQAMATYPKVVLFVEIKSHVFETFDYAAVVAKLSRVLKGNFQVISFDLPFLRFIQKETTWRVGWVLSRFEESALDEIRSHPVDTVICDIRKIKKVPDFGKQNTLWPGPWDWFLYDITLTEDQQLCETWGVKWAETWDVGRMLE